MSYPAEPKSLAYVNEFERRVMRAAIRRDDEVYLRDFIAGIAHDCPLSLIIEMSKCILAARKSELKATGEQN